MSYFVFFIIIRQPQRSTPLYSSAASDVYKRQSFKVFDTLAKKNINVDVILQSIGRAGTKDISFTVNKDDLDDAVATLEESQERLGFKELHSERNIAKLSIVGSGMLSNPGVAAKMFESLYNEGVNINTVSYTHLTLPTNREE